MAEAALPVEPIPCSDRRDHAVDVYLSAFYTGDFDRARSVVAERFRFDGPFVQADGREDFFRSAEGLRAIVRGHRLLHRWVDGDEVCSLYEVHLQTPAGTGSVTMSEWHTVHDGLLVAGRVVFDTAAFRALMPAAPAAAPRG